MMRVYVCALHLHSFFEAVLSEDREQVGKRLRVELLAL